MRAYMMILYSATASALSSDLSRAGSKIGAKSFLNIWNRMILWLLYSSLFCRVVSSCSTVRCLQHSYSLPSPRAFSILRRMLSLRFSTSL